MRIVIYLVLFMFFTLVIAASCRILALNDSEENIENSFFKQWSIFHLNDPSTPYLLKDRYDRVEVYLNKNFDLNKIQFITGVHENYEYNEVGDSAIVNTYEVKSIFFRDSNHLDNVLGW